MFPVFILRCLHLKTQGAIVVIGEAKVFLNRGKKGSEKASKCILDIFGRYMGSDRHRNVPVLMFEIIT